MSNPLLQPDGRFRRESVLDEDGRNRFAEPLQASQAEDIGPLAAPADAGRPAYQPRYTESYAHRGFLVVTLGASSFAICWLLLLTYTRYMLLGIAGAAVGMALAIATLIIGYHDLSGMTRGAIDATGRGQTILGFRLALSALFMGIGGLTYVIWLLYRGIVELAL